MSFGAPKGPQEVDVYAGRAADVLVGAVLVLAVALQDHELVFEGVEVAADGAGVPIAGDELEGDLLVAAPYPDRRERITYALGSFMGLSIL